MVNGNPVTVIVHSCMETAVLSVQGASWEHAATSICGVGGVPRVVVPVMVDPGHTRHVRPGRARRGVPAVRARRGDVRPDGSCEA